MAPRCQMDEILGEGVLWLNFGYKIKMRELIYNTGIVEEMMFDGTIIKLIKLKFPV